MRTARIAVILALALLVHACAWIYVPDVQQGNVVTQEMISQLKPGMTRRQVQLVLGTPLVADPFHQDRWDYYYSYRRGKELRAKRMVSLRFEGDLLAEITGDVQVTPDDSETLDSPAPPPPVSSGTF